MGYFCNIIQCFTLVQTCSANSSTVFLIRKNWDRVASSFSVSVCSDSRSTTESKTTGKEDATQHSLIRPRWAASLWTCQTIGSIPAVQLTIRVRHQAKWEGRKRKGSTAALEWNGGHLVLLVLEMLCETERLGLEPATTQQEEGAWNRSKALPWCYTSMIPGLLSMRTTPTQLLAKNVSETKNTI